MMAAASSHHFPGLPPFVSRLLACACLVLVFVNAGKAAGGDYQAGRELYDLGCANCHGKNLINPGTASYNLRAFPLDERKRFIDSVTNGKGFMPAMGEVFDAKEIQQLWIYVSEHENRTK